MGVSHVEELLSNPTRDSRPRSLVLGQAWIQSPGFDLLLLIFAPLAVAPIILATYFRIPLLAIGGGITLAFAHYLSSATFYFWGENAAYFRHRWVAFFLGPVLLAAGYLLLLGLGVPYIIQFALFFWNTFHVSRQNCGILSIYRHRAGVPDLGDRAAANRAILATSTFLAVWNIDTHREVSALFALVSPSLSLSLRVAAGGVALAALWQLGRALWRRVAAGHPPGLPEGVFLLTSLGFFYPYLLIRDSELATFVMLLPHYVQYMAIVWLLHRRKFGAAVSSAAAEVPGLLRLVSGRIEYLVPALLVVGSSFYVMHEIFMTAGQLWYFESLYLLIAFEHFYVDGLVWSFRRRHLRQAIAPHLLRGPESA